MLFLEFCSLKPQLPKKLLDQRQYVLETCHLVWNGLICMCYFFFAGSCRLFCFSFLISKFFSENIFKGCGEIVDVRLHVDVEFATAEAAEKVSLLT